MTVKDFSPAYLSSAPDSPEVAAESQEPLCLNELSRRHETALAKLTETTQSFDTLLEETISAVDQSITQSNQMADELTGQAAERAAAVLAEAQARTEEIISRAETESLSQFEMAMAETGELIDAAISSAGEAAKSGSEQLPSLTGEIWTALETSIEQSLKTLLEELATQAQRTKSPEPLEASQETSGTSGQPAPGTAPGGEWVIPAEAPDDGPDYGCNGQAMEPGLYSGNLTLWIILKNASDRRVIRITPEQICRQIKSVPGGSVVRSGMKGKEYFIAAHFEEPACLADVLNGVSDWEDFESKSDKVNEYRQRALEAGPEDAKCVLVTL